MKMKKTSFINSLNKTLLSFLIASIVAIPISPVSSMANENKSDDVKVLEASESKVVPAEDQKETAKQETEEDEGMSTTMWVGIGVGAAALVAVAAAAGSGGSSDSGPPTADEVVGLWHAGGIGHVQDKTYTGTYNLSAGGTHTYDLLVTSNNSGAQEHKVGNGRWYLNGANFELHNDTGSVYSGTFSNKSSVVVTTSNGWWTTTLTR